MTGKPLHILARMGDESTFPEIRVLAEIRDDSRNLLVRGVGEFYIVPPEERYTVPEEMRKEIICLLEKLPPL